MIAGNPTPRDGAKSPRREVPAVRRACSALWLLAQHPEGLNLSQAARELDIIPSTCLHILRELVAGGLVAVEPNAKLYRLGGGVLSLGRSMTQQNPFVQAAEPHLKQISQAYVVGASGQERDGDSEMLVVLATSVIAGDRIAVGERRPLMAGASGRLMGAFGGFDQAELRRRFAAVRWQDPPPIRLWLDEVRAAGRDGYAVDNGNFRKGITSIAAAAPEMDGRVHRTISVTAITAQLNSATRNNLLTALRSAAAKISKALR